ncbi:phosphoserine phosphatase [Serratia liquefaciens FK01]|nr:phosphoserine phosphatase [Serratia liquefaciens FK01]
MHRFGLGYKGFFVPAFTGGARQAASRALQSLPVNPDFINNLIVAKFTPMDKAKTHTQR